MQRKLLLILGAAAVILLAAVAGLTQMRPVGAATPVAAQQVIACSACHSMSEEVQGWEDSAHSKLACLQCHQEGDVAWVRHEFTERNPDMAVHLNMPELHTIPLKAPNDRCTECHKPQMEHLFKDLTPAKLEGAPSAETGWPMQVRALHDLHVNGEAKTDCISCHAIDAHGPKAGTEAYREAMHARCDSCHAEKQVVLSAPDGAVSCAACHIDLEQITPADHKGQALWQTAREQGGDACLSCHASIPSPHEPNYLAGHGKAFLSAAEGTCQSCHSPESFTVAPLPQFAQPQFCTECHLVPMPHPDSFLKTHGRQSTATCDACHSKQNVAQPTAPHASVNFCSSCHNAYEHPAGWVAAHGDRANDTCATCHTLQGQPGQHNACSTCHTENGSWHPKMWWVSHGKVVTQQGDASCQTCHEEVEPACSQCHTRY